VIELLEVVSISSLGGSNESRAGLSLVGGWAGAFVAPLPGKITAVDPHLHLVSRLILNVVSALSFALCADLPWCIRVSAP
jgi:hypothetical protein